MDRIIHISVGSNLFSCPHCEKKYVDEKEIYYNRIQKNKSHCTTIKCDCGKKFGLTYNFMGHLTVFKT